MRNLFLHAAFAVPGLRARAVDALTYYPPFNGLIYQGHSSAEVWVEEAQKWVLVDPWMGAAFKDNEGEFLSAAELASDRIPSKEIAVVPLVETVQRVLRTREGPQLLIQKPDVINMSHYKVIDSGHMPSYRSFYKAIFYNMPRLQE
jgi:hypothetical protein